jgi:hypothetical protein
MWAVIRFCTYMADLTLVVSRTSRVGATKSMSFVTFLPSRSQRQIPSPYSKERLVQVHQTALNTSTRAKPP